jgi:tight adherence protein B
MSDQLQLAAAVTAFGVLSFFCGVAAWWVRSRELKRLQKFVSSHVRAAGDPGAALMARSPEVSAIAGGINRKIERTNMARQLQLQLIRSGLTISPSQLLVGQVAGASLLFLVGRYILFYTQGDLALLYAVGMATPALLVPRFVLKFLENRRVTRFEGQLAQAVDVMVGALQAGSSLPQAFELVSREMPNPIGEEFGRLMKEAAVGVGLDQALRSMVERVPSMDLEMMVSAINIQYKVGGNLSHILKTIAHTIRERVRIKGELKTLTAQARLSSYIITGMPVIVVLALMVISPAYIMKLFDPGITRVMLLGGIMGMAMGYYIMKKIATIEV